MEAKQDNVQEELPEPQVEELEEEWAALSCDCTGDFF